MSSAICFDLEQCKILLSGNGLNKPFCRYMQHLLQTLRGRGEHAGNLHLLHIQQCFLPYEFFHFNPYPNNKF